MTIRVSIIVAVADNGAIGRENNLPWGRLTTDMKHFRSKTKDSAIIMGRKTAESLKEHFPLKDRLNIVLSRKGYFKDAQFVALSLEEAIGIASISTPYNRNEIFVIGGAEVYTEALVKGIVSKIYLTRVRCNPLADTFFNPMTVARAYGSRFALTATLARVDEVTETDTEKHVIEVWEKV